ncbi:MAG: chemotaxis protein CheW [Polyangiaceae bacterium]
MPSELARNFLGFRLGSVEYAVHVSLVKGVLRPQAVSEVPRMPDGVLGVVYLRGDVVPVVDLRRLLRLGPLPSGTAPKWILVNGPPTPAPDGSPRPTRQSGAFVLVVDTVSGVFGASIADERPAPEMLAASDVPKILFVTKREDALVFTLDLSAISAHLPELPPLP